MTTRERRRSPRVRLQAFAALRARPPNPNDQAFSAVRNVSRNGIAVATGQPPFVGQRVVLRLAIGEDIQTIQSVATRVLSRGKDLFDVGLDWSHCSPEDRAFLAQFLQLAAAQKQKSRD